jgi:ABC-type transporter Mla MlaB component
MAKKKHRLGFDPLAWMKDPTANRSPPTGPSAAPDAGRVTEPAPAQALSATAPASPGLPPAAAPGRAESIRLCEALTRANVRALYDELKAALDKAAAARGERALTLEAAAVESVDGAGLQLLAAFARAAKARGVAIRWREVPGALREDARRLGLDESLSWA